MRRVLVVMLLLVSGALPAAADGADHTHRPVVDGVEPAIAGLTVEVRAEPAPTIVVRNRSGETLEVDALGAPFLRIGPDDVQANAASPEFYRSESPSPAVAIPPSATGGERFVHLVDGADWAWFEHRISATPVDEPWRIPIRVGDVDAEIVGRWEAVEVPAQVVTTLDPLDVDGLDFAVLPGLAPALYVRNTTDDALVVDDPRGEPFLRIGPGQTTRATPGGDAEVVAPTPSYAWVDPRIGWQGDPPSGAARRTWELPMRLGERDLVLTGATEWVPLDEPEGSGGIPPAAIAAVIAVPAALGLWLARKDKRA